MCCLNWKLLLFYKDKKEVEASLTLGLTLRGIQIFQVGLLYCTMKQKDEQSLG